MGFGDTWQNVMAVRGDASNQPYTYPVGQSTLVVTFDI